MFRTTKTILALLLLSAAGAQAGLSKLDALGMIESGNNDAAVGSLGEVSRYQIKPHIWREYASNRSWRDVRVSAAVAQEYLAHLENTFRRRAGREPGDFDLYVLWNAGPSYYAKAGFSSRRVHPVIRERAQRYVNLRQMNPPGAMPKVEPAKAVSVAPSTPATAPATENPPLMQALAQRPAPAHSPGVAAVMPGLSSLPSDPPPIPAGRGQSSSLAGGVRGR